MTFSKPGAQRSETGLRSHRQGVDRSPSCAQPRMCTAQLCAGGKSAKNCREQIALTKNNYMQSNKYVWFGSATDSSIQHDGTVKGLLSNIYYKYLNGEMYKRAGNGIGSRLERSYWVGDRFGKPVRGNGSVTLISGQTRKLCTSILWDGYNKASKWPLGTGQFKFVPEKFSEVGYI